MTRTKSFVDRVYDDFLSIPQKAKDTIDGLPKITDRFFPKDKVEKIQVDTETKIIKENCYQRIQIIETKTIDTATTNLIAPVQSRKVFVKVIYDHTFFDGENCLPNRKDDPPSFEDDVIPDYPDDTPDIAIFVETNRVTTFTDYFNIFSCDYGLSVKIGFKNIEIIDKDRINFTVETEVNLKDRISLLPPIEDEGSQPNRNVPWLKNYVNNDKIKPIDKRIYTNNVSYNGQKNVYKKYKGKMISAYISDITDTGYVLIGHPLIVNREFKKILKQLTWTRDTPFWEGMSEKYFVFLRELNIQYNGYYNITSTDPHYQSDYRVRVKRYNAVDQSIPLVLYYEVKEIKVVVKPINPDKPKECDCMSCDDKLAKLILSKLNSLISKVGDFPVEILIKDSDPNKEGNQEKKIKLNSIAAYIKETFNSNNDIAKILGISRFPAKLPKRLIIPNGKDYENITDLPEYLGFMIKQIDKAIGFLPQKIKIADSDLAKEGNQPLEVEVHSLADFARETLKILLDGQPESDVQTNMLIRILYELGFIHQGAIQILANVDAMVEHLDFKHKFIVKEYPFAFNPYCNNSSMARGFGQNKNDKELKEPAKLPDISNAEDVLEKMLSKLLQQTWIKVRTIENIEKRSLNQDIQSIRRDANTAALAVATKADPKILEELVNNALIKLETQDMIQQISVKKSMITGDLRTRTEKKEGDKKGGK